VISWRQWLLSIRLALGGVILVGAPGHAGILDASWTAPTTDADGNPLTDLVWYRVYYGASAIPCPGSSFSQVISATPDPPANQTVTFRLAGLSAGALYNFSITAVDTSGNESACSIAASAVARLDFGVSPSGTVNFGSVNVGSFADQVFTVSNTGGGTASGAVSTSAPFSIVSGSSFKLVGLGASQVVRVRFTPTTLATATANVAFAADGDAISRIAIGTGTATPPTVTITSPTSASTYSTSNPLLTLGGTASGNAGVTQVTWANSRGDSGTAIGTTTWTASGIPLRLGMNVLTVTARDAGGNAATAALTVTLTGTFAFTDDPLTAQSTPIRSAHIMEIRAAIDSVRVARGLETFDWTDPTLTPGSTPIKGVHLAELRTALNEAYEAAGRTPPSYTQAIVVAGVTIIRAVDLNELHAAVRALE